MVEDGDGGDGDVVVWLASSSGEVEEKGRKKVI